MAYSVVIFISGRGSYAGHAVASPALRDLCFTVVADRPQDDRAVRVDRTLPRHGTPDYWDRFRAIASDADLVMLNFNWIVPAEVCETLRGKLINQHPALLPSFRGLFVQDAVLAGGVRVSGSTFHFVTPALDEGPIIAQTLIPVRPDDTTASLAERNWGVTRHAYVQVLRWFADGRVHLHGDGRVVVDGGRYDLAPCVPNLELPES